MDHGAIGDGGVNPDGMVILTTPKLAFELRTMASPKTDERNHLVGVFASRASHRARPRRARGRVRRQRRDRGHYGATVHFEDTTPLAIGTPGTPPTVAAPTHSAFQEDLLIVKARGRCAWTVQPGAVAVINGAAW